MRTADYRMPFSLYDGSNLKGAISYEICISVNPSNGQPNFNGV